MEKTKIQKALVESLQETIRIHGPITKQLVGSVTKRIIGRLESILKRDNEKVS